MNTAKFIEDELFTSQEISKNLTVLALKPRKKLPCKPEEVAACVELFGDSGWKRLAVLESAVRSFSVETLVEHDIIRLVMEAKFPPTSDHKRYYTPIDPVQALFAKLSSKVYEKALTNSMLIEHIFEEILIPDMKGNRLCDTSSVMSSFKFLKHVAFEDAEGYIRLDKLIVDWKDMVIVGSATRPGYGDSFPNSFTKKMMVEENAFLRESGFQDDVIDIVAPQLLMDPIIEGPKRLDMDAETFFKDCNDFNKDGKHSHAVAVQMLETYLSMYVREIPLESFTLKNVSSVKSRHTRKYMMTSVVKTYGVYAIAEAGVLPAYFSFGSNSMNDPGPDHFRAFFSGMKTELKSDARKNLDIVVQLLTESGANLDHLNFLQHLTVAFSFVYSDDEDELYELYGLVPKNKVRAGKNADDYRAKMIANLTEANKFLDIDQRKKLRLMLA